MIYTPHGVRAYVAHKGRILILKRSDTDTEDSNSWDIPGGRIESGENIFIALKREILEETGIRESDVSIKDMIGFLVEPYSKDITLQIALFSCESATDRVSVSDEHSEFRWVTPEELGTRYRGRFLDGYNHFLPNPSRR